MGKGLENIQINSLTMLDPRAQLFNVHQNPRWFLNQAESQPTVMSFLEADQAMGFSPLGHGPQLMPQVAFTPATTTHRSSSDRNTSTDTPSPTPDGPGPDIGNDNCQSPYPDSICSFATDVMFDHDHRSPSMGTPNSFIGIVEPQTPDRSHFTPRERLYSTASSPYTYSPYTPLEIEDEAAMGPEQIQSAPPRMDRQHSLALVEEVLGCNELAYDQPALEGLSQNTISPFNEDSNLPPCPSPSFLAHFNASSANAHAITDSQTDDFFAGLAYEMPTTFMQCDGSPSGSNEAPQSISRSNSNNCNVDETTTDTGTPATSEQNESSAQNGDVSVNAPTRSSFLVPTTQFLSDTMPSNSLDYAEMMKDCFESLAIPNQPNNDLKTISVEAIAAPEDQGEPAVQEEEIPAPPEQPRKTPKRPRKGKTAKYEDFVADPQTPSTSKQENVDPSWERRERNNEACRQSRKRRKNKRVEMELLAERYTTENRELEEKIGFLEVECKKVKKAILAHMMDNKNK